MFTALAIAHYVQKGVFLCEQLSSGYSLLSYCVVASTVNVDRETVSSIL